MNRRSSPTRYGWTVGELHFGPLKTVRKIESGGFTLVELLVVVAITALLLGIMLPSLSKARLAARVVKAHADLRSIDQALLMYQQEHRDDLPPTRFSCSSGATFPLPVELGEGRYLQVEVPEGEQQTLLQDVFNPIPDQSYKYRLPGPAWVNTTTYMANGSWLWIPDDAPACQSTAGDWFNNREAAAVQYAAWSVGPDDGLPPAIEVNKHPLPQAAWYGNRNASGVITHYQADSGTVYMSP
jgi:prepilin-type N-terminal cleavage/methylation domain-containing protein